MANICEYKVLVKGKRGACYAFIGAMPQYDDYTVIKTETNPDEEHDFAIYFNCCCKWSVDAYAKDDDDTPVVNPDEIPNDISEAVEYGRDLYSASFKSKTRILGVDAICVSLDIDEPCDIYVEHYDCGDSILTYYSDLPDELKMSEFENLFNEGECENNEEA